MTIVNPSAVAQQIKNSPSFHLIVGTYTSGKSEGIYVYRFDSKTGKLEHTFTAKGVENPSFVVLSPDGQYLYAVNEVSGEKEGSVSAFRFNRETGALEFINKQASGGGDPAYLTVDQKGENLFVGNYTGGNLSVLPVQKDGSLGAAIQTIQHAGSSVNKERQEKAHVHSTVLGPEEKHLFVGDLGTDKVNIYEYHPESNQPLKPAATPFIAVEPGTGPRHLIFDELGDYAYLVQELTAEVSVFRHENGKLSHVQTVPMTEPDFKGAVSAAEVKISPDGKFLYASNRGDANEIVIYKIGPEKGTLTLVDRQSTLGKTPRNFTIDPTGRFLLVAHQNSDNVIVFARDIETGKLSPTGEEIEVGKPVYLKMVPVE
ncbi:lactonase family protein [Nafulsella turpanensis]|uniref:lactonase family protein n=1 Tax=Nafulsella turpanensis TaxID=1265690 RepID=UPI00037FB39A|nr:lactonase family protein [Nafulsella turpanensis]